MEAPWEVQQLRVSIFATPPLILTPELWLAVVGSPPESETKRPREGLTLFTGVLDGAQVAMNSTAAQFDFLLGPPQGTAPTGLSAFPKATAGEAKPIIALVQSKIPAVFDFSPETARIAFAGTVLKPTADVRESYGQLATLLQSVKVRPEKMRDFNYRVNWPVTVDGVEINRLTSWSAALYRALGLKEGMPETVFSEHHYAQLEFDVNNVPSPATKFTPQQLRDLFPRLIALVQENMERGEVVAT